MKANQVRILGLMLAFSGAGAVQNKRGKRAGLSGNEGEAAPGVLATGYAPGR